MAESKYDKYVLREAKTTMPVFPPKDLINIGFDQKYMEKLGNPTMLRLLKSQTT